MSLPGLLGLTPNSEPAGPYLAADPEREQRWRQMLGESQALRVGIVWQGNPQFQ